MEVVIHRHRPGKPSQRYVEGFVDDDGRRLRTLTALPAGFRPPWMPGDRMARSVAKYHFYEEPFGIMELRDADGNVLCHYCDVLTPLQKRDGEYHVGDLFLDLVILPDGTVRELDHDELDAAEASGLLSARAAADARAVLARLKAAAAAGAFPASHVG